jgi:hypothetical protein
MKSLNLKMSSRLFIIVFTMIFLVGISSCTENAQNDTETDSQTDTELDNANQEVVITEQEVEDAQKAWGEGIVKIGKVFSEEGDYKAAATEHINNFYNYQEGSVLFKPTLTSVKQFRTDFQGALSYFVGGDENFAEDKGFAIKPWSNVRWENIGTKIIGNMAIAMGNYYFTPSEGGDDVKVEYSFAYTKDKDGNLKIILHDSHLPYNPSK